MDMREFDERGRTICPNCKKAYYPVLGVRKFPTIAIQKEFPDATSEEREQLVTGICSDQCWEEYLGGN